MIPLIAESAPLIDFVMATGVEIALGVTALVATLASTGVAVHQAETQKQAAEDASDTARKRAKLVATLRGREADKKLRAQLAEQSAAAASGPIAVLGASEQVAQASTTRNILSSLRNENLGTLTRGLDASNQLENAAFGFQQQGVQAGIQGVAQSVQLGANTASLLKKKPATGGTKGFTAPNNSAGSAGFSAGNIS